MFLLVNHENIPEIGDIEESYTYTCSDKGNMPNKYLIYVIFTMKVMLANVDRVLKKGACLLAGVLTLDFFI